MQTRQLVQIALFPALLAILAQIAIPLPFTPVPLTGQFIGLFLAPAILGTRGAVLAVLSYLLLGAAGVPVFAMAQGGLGIILGPTGGYLLGFLPGVYLAGLLLQNHPSPGMLRTSASMGTCMVCTYLAGSLQLKLIMGYTLPQTLMVGVLPYLPLDLAKIAFTAALSIRLRARLKASGGGH
ncbi:MAG TPA: biotin transporter BioY [Firmicutes bacterium]|nr:biotin transporter BioY [Bacillota bacterium]